MDPQQSVVPHVAVPTTITGLLIAAVVVLAGVIAFLFKLYVSRNKETETALREMQEKHAASLAAKDASISDERKNFAAAAADWDSEIEKLRADYERNLRETAELAEFRELQLQREEKHSALIAEIRNAQLNREDGMRKDFGDRVERIAAEASRAAQEQSKVLDKIYERFVGPRRQPR